MGARTGEQFLEGLRKRRPTLWVGSGARTSWWTASSAAAVAPAADGAPDRAGA